MRAVLGTPRLCDGAVALGAIDDAGVAHGGIERHVESDGHLLDDDAGEAPKDDVRFDLEDAPSAAAAAREAVLPPQLAGLALAPRAIVAGLQQHSPVHVALRPSPRRRARAEVLRGVREGRLRRPAQPPPAARRAGRRDWSDPFSSAPKPERRTVPTFPPSVAGFSTAPRRQPWAFPSAARSCAAE